MTSSFHHFADQQQKSQNEVMINNNDVANIFVPILARKCQLKLKISKSKLLMVNW